MQLSESELEKIKRSVERAFEELAEAARSLEHDEYLKHFDRENFTALNADGTVALSFEEFENMYRQQVAVLKSYESLEFSNVKITVINPQTAILVNEFEASVLLKSGEVVSASGGGMQVWTETEGNWKLVSVSSSS
jgi:hypothetical protein